MSNLIVILILTVIIGSSIAKIFTEKKKGAKCIGCPYSGLETKNCSCSQKKSK